MAQSIPALIEPSVLRWARESIGLVPVAAARKIGVPDGRVAGTATPSVDQLTRRNLKRVAAETGIETPPATSARGSFAGSLTLTGAG